MKLVTLRQSVPKNPSEPLVLRSGERWLAVSGSGVDDSVNSASGVIARKLSNKMKDLAAVAETQQDVSHVFAWSDEECLGVQIGWYCCAVDMCRCEDTCHAVSKM